MIARSNLEKALDTDAGQNIIVPLLEAKDYRQLMLINRSRYKLFKDSSPDVVLFNRFSPSVLTHRLVYHFAFVPDEEKAKATLEQNLDLLKIEFKKIVFPLYTVTNVTLLQLVHGAGDIEMRDQVLKPLFVKLYGEEKGIEEMQRQIGELKNIHKPFDFGPIIEAISNELFDNGKDEKGRWNLSPNTLAAIEKFRQDFDNNQPKIIDKAMQFRWETLEEFNKVYSAAAKQWNYDSKKCALLEDAVQTWVLRYAMENDKQRFNQGVHYLQQANPQPFRRLQINRDGASFDVSLSRESIDFVLSGSCVDIVYGRACLCLGVRQLAGTWAGPSYMREFLSNKNFKLAELCPNTPERKRRRV